MHKLGDLMLYIMTKSVILEYKKDPSMNVGVSILIVGIRWPYNAYDHYSHQECHTGVENDFSTNVAVLHITLLIILQT